MNQRYFNYNLKPQLKIEDYFVSSSNMESYNILIKNYKSNNIFLYGPKKSGKTHLGLIWKDQYKAIIFNNNLETILNNKKNIFIDNIFQNIIEEDIFHIINHCYSYNLNLLVTSNIFLNYYQFKLEDLSSRLKTFINIKIDLPDDNLLVNLMTKLFNDKQIIIKNPELFNYILKRVNRSYEKIFLLVEKIDNLSLEKKKQLTIPLIKNLM